jgi:hypothetical protein
MTTTCFGGDDKEEEDRTGGCVCTLMPPTRSLSHSAIPPPYLFQHIITDTTQFSKM